MNNELEKVKNVRFDYLKKSNNSEDILLSIVVPTYKRGILIKDSLDSILCQSKAYKNVEVIVVSNDPEDNLEYLINLYSVYDFTMVRNCENLGMCGNINKCITLAKGKYISFVHDDDMITKDYLETVLDYLSRFKDVDCFIPMRYTLNSDSLWGKSRQRKGLIKHIFSILLSPIKIFQKEYYVYSLQDIFATGRNCFSAPTCGTIYKKESIINVGAFDSNWKYAFDFIFYENFVRYHKIILIKKPLGIYRMLDSASNSGIVQLEFFKALKHSLDKNLDIKMVNKFYYEYLHLFYMGLSSDARILIEKEYGEIISKWNKTKYMILRIKTEFYYFSSGIETSKYLSKHKKKELGLE